MTPAQDSPLITILMATYNGAEFLEEQIASIQNQTHQNWQLLVSDDCSTDSTLQMLRRFEQDDPRIRVVSSGDRRGGAKENFGHLISVAPAGYVAFSDQDDVWREDKLERLLETMQKLEAKNGATRSALVFSDAEIVGQHLEPVAPSFLAKYHHEAHDTSYARTLTSNLAPGCTILANAALIDLARPVALSPATIMHDWLLVLLAQGDGEIACVEAPLIKYRQHGTNALGAADSKTAWQILRSKLRGASRSSDWLRAKDFNLTLAQARVVQAALPADPIRPEDRTALLEFCSIRPRSPLHNARAYHGSHIQELGARAWVMRYGALTYGLFD